jgi:hypothetical protein
MLKVYGSLFNMDLEKLKSVVDLLINKTPFEWKGKKKLEVVIC